MLPLGRFPIGIHDSPILGVQLGVALGENVVIRKLGEPLHQSAC
jgi:hypothetical protein